MSQLGKIILLDQSKGAREFILTMAEVLHLPASLLRPLFLVHDAVQVLEFPLKVRPLRVLGIYNTWKSYNTAGLAGSCKPEIENVVPSRVP